MPTLLIIENVTSPTPRVVKQLRSAAEHGWATKVVIRTGGDRSASRPASGSEEPWETITVPGQLAHPFATQRRRSITELSERLASLRARQEQQIEALRRSGDEAFAPEHDGVHPRRELELLKSEASEVAARKRILHAATRIPTPFGRPHGYGDLLRMESYWQELLEVLAAHDWDVAQAADLDSLPPVVWSCQARSGPGKAVLDSHELYPELSNVPDVFREGWRELARTFIPATDAVIATSEEMAEELVRRYAAPQPTVVRNCPTVGARADMDLRERTAVAPSAILAVHIGGLREKSRPERLVTFARMVPDLHVALLGADPHGLTAERLRSTALRSGVADRLHFVGSVPHEATVDAVREADVSLVPAGPVDASMEVSLPNKLFDALAAGVPVVAAEGTATGTFVTRHGVGCTFDPDRPTTMSTAIEQVMSDPNLREAAHGISGRVTWHWEEDAYLGVLERALGG